MYLEARPNDHRHADPELLGDGDQVPEDEGASDDTDLPFLEDSLDQHIMEIGELFGQVMMENCVSLCFTCVLTPCVCPVTRVDARIAALGVMDAILNRVCAQAGAEPDCQAQPSQQLPSLATCASLEARPRCQAQPNCELTNFAREPAVRNPPIPSRPEHHQEPVESDMSECPPQTPPT